MPWQFQYIMQFAGLPGAVGGALYMNAPALTLPLAIYFIPPNILPSMEKAHSTQQSHLIPQTGTTKNPLSRQSAAKSITSATFRLRPSTA